MGAEQVGKYSLVRRLLLPANATDKASDTQQLWHLDTKYYTTDVSVQRSIPTEEAHQLAADVQGLVLVFAANSEASFTAIKQWAEQQPSSISEIKLCVANKADAIAANHASAEQAAVMQRTGWLDAAMLWCAENQLEYIEASSINSSLDESLVLDEQQQGIHRIRQALEANYWPNLVMKQPHLNLTEPQSQNSQQSSQIADNLGTAQTSTTASSTSSQSSDGADDSFAAFQSAEEAELDQYDKMFGELRGEECRTWHAALESTPFMCSFLRL